MHVLHRASGGMTDTPELRARLHELGSRAYDYGHGSFSPDEVTEYNNLTNFYNFPRHVGSGHMTREDEDAAMLEHLQNNIGRGRTEETYAAGGDVYVPRMLNRADGGIVDKALGAFGEQGNPIAVARQVAASKPARRAKTKQHPALNIPGVHIRTAEAGEPIFHGEK
jgi:hypothetical protein